MTPIQLFESNLWVMKFIRLEKGYRPLEFQEYVQEVWLIYWKCCLCFDETKGVKFSSYVIKSVKKALKRLIITKSLIISVKSDCWLDYCNIKSKITRYTRKTVIEDGRWQESKRQKRVEEIYDEKVRSLKNITGRQGKILRMYYLENLTMQEIADKLNVSKARIGEIVRRCKGAI